MLGVEWERERRGWRDEMGRSRAGRRPHGAWLMRNGELRAETAGTKISCNQHVTYDTRALVAGSYAARSPYQPLPMLGDSADQPASQTNRAARIAGYVLSTDRLQW